MVDGSALKTGIVNDFIKVYRMTSFVTRSFFVLALVFLIISFWHPFMLALVGSMFVGMAALFNIDRQVAKESLDRELEKIATLNRFQSELIILIQALAGIRANYEKFLKDKKVRDSHFRSLEIPWIAYIPDYDINVVVKKNWPPVYS